MKEITRRQFLRSVAAGVAGIGISSVLPGLHTETEASSAPSVETISAFASNISLTILGARGSTPISRNDSMIFGGSTSCYMLCACDETIFLDAGSGLFSAPAEYPKPPVFLLSHLHFDHLMGLGMFSHLSQKEAETTIFVPTEYGNAVQAIDGLYSPPYWPLRLSNYGSNVQILPHSFPLQIGNITVDGIKGCHPGGVWCFRIQCCGKTLVYASDFEHEEPYFSELIEFSREADLVLYDGQYTVEEYERNKGYGHSTTEKGLELLERSGAKQLLLVHHDPSHTDRQLLNREAQIGRANVHFAREGEVISI